jgi:putative Ca2+/H+ antiporter (TMEM165/GDT1 family)
VEAFFVSTGLVAVAEIGDKTQLLALILAARYRKPLPICAGILVATLANHLIAAWAGTEIAGWIGPATMRWVVAASFIVMAIWCLVPDKLGESRRIDRLGPFLATLISFFLVEIGDKTQIATVALAARYEALLLVTAGTTLGMMIANMPVVLFGDVIARRIPLNVVRMVTASIFLALGLLAAFRPPAL